MRTVMGLDRFKIVQDIGDLPCNQMHLLKGVERIEKVGSSITAVFMEVELK